VLDSCVVPKLILLQVGTRKQMSSSLAYRN
jgi:hypothetical protein